jgi:1-acyl-sn-glycerol-3-phosphate acyltransferase
VEATYATTIAAARLVFLGLGLRLTVEGDEHVPTTGPVVIASNHVSFLDFMLVGLAARRSRRHVRFLARHDVWRGPLVGRAMVAMRHVPVDPAAPAAAYLQARTLLRAGEAVGVFPEAGVSTSYTVRALMPGAVALAAETGAPVLPMAIWGPQRIATAHHRWDLRRGRPVTIRVGRPYVVAPCADARAETRRLGCVLQRLLDDVQTRPTHRPPPGEAAWWQPAHLGGGAPTPAAARPVETTVPRTAVAPTWRPGPRR